MQTLLHDCMFPAYLGSLSGRPRTCDDTASSNVIFESGSIAGSDRVLSDGVMVKQSYLLSRALPSAV
jgi:hypothetical protein